MQVIKYVILTNKLTETYVANADHNAIQLELDFTGTDYADWTKWVQLLMNDGTEDLQELGTDAIVHFTLTSAHTKQGYLSINPKAISETGAVKGFPIRTVSIDKQLNVEQVSSELQQSIIDYFNQRLAIKSVSTETLEPDQPANVVVQQAADGQTYQFSIPKGVKGNTGSKIVSAAFSGNDIVFTLDDGSTATLIGAAITLKGIKGDTGAKITSAAFVGNDIVFTLEDASTVTLIDAAITLKGLKGDKGIVWRGAYAAETAYVVDDVVSYLGSSYICVFASMGNLPTNSTYWQLFATTGTVIAANVTNTPSGNVLSLNVQDAINELDTKKAMGNIVSDTTYNNSWISGTPTVDPATNTFTLPGHGLANNVPVEFDAGTGVLPGGLSQYNSDIYGGTYYNAINVVGDTFQVTDTVGGTTPVDILSAGIAGWRIRKALCFTTSIIFPLSIPSDDYSEKIVVISGFGGKYNTSTENYNLRLNANADYVYATVGSSSFTNAYLPTTLNMQNKYSTHNLVFRIRRVLPSLIIIHIQTLSIDSAAKAASTVRQSNWQTAFAYGTAAITSFGGAWNGGTGGLRNGANVKVIKGL